MRFPAGEEVTGHSILESVAWSVLVHYGRAVRHRYKYQLAQHQLSEKLSDHGSRLTALVALISKSRQKHCVDWILETVA
jgi:hypothetical protein